MERLTTDNPDSNVETRNNLAYVKNRWVTIRGMEESFLSYMRLECGKKGCDITGDSDELTDENICECAFSSPECPLFLLYMVAIQASESREKLKQYEDTELMPNEILKMKEGL